MKLIYTRVTKQLANCFVVNFEFEHGDADSISSYPMTLQLNEEQLKDYLSKFFEVARLIDNSRANGAKLAGVNEIKVHGYTIPTESDCYAEMRDYYASMGVTSIRYFDSTGAEFDVRIDMVN